MLGVKKLSSATVLIQKHSRKLLYTEFVFNSTHGSLSNLVTPSFVLARAMVTFLVNAPNPAYRYFGIGKRPGQPLWTKNALCVEVTLRFNALPNSAQLRTCVVP